MKNALLSLCLVFFISSNSFAKEYFYIENLDVEVELQTDGSFWVHETIDVFFTQRQRGIFRSIPVSYKVEALPNGTKQAKRDGLQYDIYLDSISVENWEYKEVTSDSYMNIRIGSVDKFIEGKQQYKIHYKVYNAINHFPEHSEFYWNVIGTEWEVPIKQSSFRIKVPKLVSNPQQSYRVFAGRIGSTEKVFTESFDGSILEGSSLRTLGTKEGVSVAMAFPDNYFTKKELPMSVIADRFYLKKWDTDITFSEDGTAKVRETYIVNFLKPMHQISRRFEPTIDWCKPFESPKIIGGQYTYSLEVNNVQDISYNSNSNHFHLDTKKSTGGEDRVFEIEYEVFGNFYDSKEKAAHLQFDHVINPHNTWGEPIESATVTLHFPEGRTGSKVEAIIKGNGASKAVNKNRIDLNTVVINTKSTIMGREYLAYNVFVPNGYFDSAWLKWMNLFFKNNWILFLPFLIFALVYRFWLKRGKDEEFSVMTAYHPPMELTPAESGILIDDQLHDRDLLALIPYWASRGHLTIEEHKEKVIFGLGEKIDFEFHKVKDLPSDAHTYEHTLFNGIFKKGNDIKLSSLVNKFYETMEKARKELEAQIKKRSFYEPYTRGFGVAMTVFGLMGLLGGIVLSVFGFASGNEFQLLDIGITVGLAGITLLIFGSLCPKKPLLDWILIKN